MFRTIAATGIVAAGLALSAGAAQANDVMVCVENNAGVAGKYNITFYAGDNEAREDRSDNSFSLGNSACYKKSDVRAMNVTIWGWTTKWEKICDINRRPGQSLKVQMKGTVFNLSCGVF